MKKIYIIQAVWHDDDQCWVAESDDVPGLATGADTLEELVKKLEVVVPELLEANGLVRGNHPPLPFAVQPVKIPSHCH